MDPFLWVEFFKTVIYKNFFFMRFEENTFFFYELSFDHESVIYEQYLFLSLPLLPMIFFFFLHGNVFFLQVPSSQSPSTPGEQAPRSADPSFVSTQGESFIFKVLLSPPPHEKY